MIRLLRCVAMLLGLSWVGSASALCTIVCACNVSTTSLIFAPLNPLSVSNNDSTGTVIVNCAGVVGLSIPYTVALSAGTSAALSARQMASGAKRLSYNVYTSSGYTTVWGDGSGATQTVGGTIGLDFLGSSSPQNLTVYGRIPGGQSSVAPGSYADTLVVTLTYF